MTRTARLRISVELLEDRRLFAVTPINGANGTLIDYGAAVDKFRSAGVTGAGQTIAVIDSGIDYTQPALGGGFGAGFKVVGGYDFVDNDNDPMDAFGHGTEVAGVIAADPFTVDGVNYQGIAPDAKLVALRVDDADESTSVPDSKIEDALQWVIDHRTQYGITVVNVSYGQGDFDTATYSTVYGSELKELHDDGVVVVAAAGNNPDSSGATAKGGINSPAADANVISVGSVESDDAISDFSLRGAPLTLLAPGDDIVSTLQSADGGGYGVFAGTSFAAPIVAGTVALMRNVDSTLTPADTRSILRASGVANFDGDLEKRDGVTVTRMTYPRLDVLNALDLTKSRRQGSDAQQAAVGQHGNQTSLAIDSDGVTHYAYYDAAAKTMKYVTRSSTGLVSAAQTVDTSNVEQGYDLSLAVNPQGQPAIAYFDGYNGDLKYADYDGTSWHVQTLDAKNSTGAYPSLVFDQNGLPAISYYKKTGGDLRIARGSFNGTWTIQTVASLNDVGRYSAIAVDSRGRLGIAFEDTTNGWLNYSSRGTSDSKWTTLTIDKNPKGISFISNAFNPADRTPWVSYYDANPANLRVDHQVNHRWRSQIVASRGATGLYSNLFFTGSDDPKVLYWDKRLDALQLATLDDDSDTWSTRILQRNGGRFVSGVVDSTRGTIRYAYYDTATKSDQVTSVVL